MDQSPIDQTFIFIFLLKIIKILNKLKFWFRLSLKYHIHTVLGEKTLYFLSLTFETSINIISIKISIIVARIKNKNITLVNEIT